MAICEIHFGCGNVLAKGTSAIVLIPEGKPGPFPVLYLLHGLWDDHTGWTRRTSIERYVEGLPLIVVMPNGDRGFYTDSPTSPTSQYETYVSRDLTAFVDNTFHTITDRQGRAIAGLSMGGYGALKLALKHPNLYCAASAHSSAADIVKMTQHEWLLSPADYRTVFGPSPAGGPDDLFAVAESADRATLPALRLDCGVDDYLIEDNRRFHTHLTELCIPHEYHEYPGSHDWEYWQKGILRALPWIAKQLGIEPNGPLPEC